MNNKCIVLLVVPIFFCVFVWVFPVQASTCRHLENNYICINYIKRSAKNYWQYRASVTINHVTRPIEVYDCRQKVRIISYGVVIPFQINGAGELLCSFFNSSS